MWVSRNVCGDYIPAPKWYRVIISGGEARWYRSLSKAKAGHPNHIVDQYATKDDSRGPIKTIRPEGQDVPDEVRYPGLKEAIKKQRIVTTQEYHPPKKSKQASLFTMEVAKGRTMGRKQEALTGPIKDREGIILAPGTPPYTGPKPLGKFKGLHPEYRHRISKAATNVSQIRDIVFVRTWDSRYLDMGEKGLFVDPDTGEILEIDGRIRHLVMREDIKDSRIRILEDKEADAFLAKHKIPKKGKIIVKGRER